VASRHAVASQLISYDHPRYILQALQQSAEEALGGLGIAAILNKDVEDNTVLDLRHARDSAAPPGSG